MRLFLKNGCKMVAKWLVFKKNRINMPSITIKNIPDTVLTNLRQQAALNRRSLNQEILFRFEHWTTPQPQTHVSVLPQLQELKAQFQQISTIPLATTEKSLVDAFLNSPLVGVELDLSREFIEERSLELS